MRFTENLNLALYEATDKMSVTAEENSLNANMEILDKEVKRVSDSAESALKVVPQELTEEQQNQALSNIGLGVSYKEVWEQLVGTLNWDIGHYYNNNGEYKTAATFSCVRIAVREGDEISVKGIASSDISQGSFTSGARAVYFNGNTKVSNPWNTATWDCDFVVPSGVDSMTITVAWKAESEILSNVSITRKAIKPYVNISTDIRDLKHSNLADKRWVSFGDSITARNGWQPYLVERYGLAHTNLGIGSTCMAQCNANPMCADTRIDLIKSANPDIVTILGGANDLVYVDEGRVSIGDESQMHTSEKDKTTFYGAFSYVVESLLAWKPTLRIIILGMYYANADGAIYSSTVTYSDFSEAARKVAEHYSLPFVDLHGCGGFNAFTMGSNRIYSTDALHPNDAGCRRISELVSACMEGLFLFDV